MIAPGAVVGNVHALLALAGGFHQEAIHVHQGLREEGGGLLRPHPAAGGVEDVEEEDVLEDAGDLEDDSDAIGPDIEVEQDSDETER